MPDATIESVNSVTAPDTSSSPIATALIGSPISAASPHISSNNFHSPSYVARQRYRARLLVALAFNGPQHTGAGGL